MGLVPTVRGEIDAGELGRTYMHEHLFIRTADVQRSRPEEWGDDETRIADAVSRMRALAAQGVRTIVDPTVLGMGRDVALVGRVAEQVPELNIVVATGIYTYDSVPFYFRHRGPGLAPGAPDPMDELFVDEITRGIPGSGGVRAGMLKCAIDAEGLTPGVERVMRAVARAHHRTGAPVTVHTHPGSRTAGEVKRVLCDEEQVDPSRVVLGHSGDSTDCDHLAELADDGFVLGMDRFGLHLDVTFEQRAATLVEMCRRGYAGSMVLAGRRLLHRLDRPGGPAAASAVEPPAPGRGSPAPRPRVRGDRPADQDHAGGRAAPPARRHGMRGRETEPARPRVRTLPAGPRRPSGRDGRTTGRR